MPSYNSTARMPFKRGGKVSSTKKKPYHDKTTLAKSERHPHSRLKTQKEYKAITDSPAYKKADYHTQNKMLKKHPTTMKKGGLSFREGGRTEFNGGSKDAVKKKKRLTWKEKKLQKRKKESQQVSRETIHEAIKDADYYNKKPKVHTTKKGHKATIDRVSKLIDKQVYFHPEAELKHGYGKIRDKGWGGKHSQKKPEQN